jgi:H+/Cl- antiporter ClcA
MMSFWESPRPRLHRILRKLVLALRHSRRRIAFIAGGVAVGLAASLFAILSDKAQSAAFGWIERWPWLPLFLTPAGFAAITYVTRRFVPHAKGSGIPQTIAARHVRGSALSRQLVSLRVAIGKIALTLLGLLCGASTGREGPTVQIGAAIMSAVGDLTRIQRTGLLLAGASAGVAAAFNTPLAGIVFGIEEMSQSYERRSSGLTLAAIIVAGITAMAVLGNYTYFGLITVKFPETSQWFAIPVCGAVGGLLGGAFSRCVVAIARGLPGKCGRFIAERPIVFAALCGLGVAVCGLASGSSIYGTGYNQARGLLDATSSVPHGFGIIKILATFLSTISGIPGGIFSPSLAIGAGLGANIATVFPHVDPAVLLLMGMVAYLTGVVQAPITAFVIVSEMTDAHDMIIPLMATALVAHSVSRLIIKKGIYHALAAGILDRAASADKTGGKPHGESHSLS